MNQSNVLSSLLSVDVFSNDFWNNDFPLQTQNGIAPFLFKNVLPPDFAGVSAVTKAIQNFQNPNVREAISSHLRVYVGEERVDHLVERLVNEPFLPKENLFSFMKRITNKERFSLVANNFEQLCPELAADIGKFLYAMFSVRGAPIGGCEQVVFAGNYSGTAFGVHEGYEHAFLVHLGPGVKEFYCWSQEIYLKLTNGSREPTYGDYNWMLEYGQKFILEPGDILYLPALVYHVGRQSDFSISVAVPLYTYPKERFFTKVIVPGLSALQPFDLEGMSKHVALNNGSNNFANELLPIAKNIFSDYMRKELDLILAYRWNRLVSNGFWEISDNYVSSPLNEFMPNSDTVILQKNSKLRLISPYRICWEKALNCLTDELRVFIRSCSVVVPNKKELIALLNKLNNSEVVTLSEDWQLPIFNTLLQTGGLQRE